VNGSFIRGREMLYFSPLGTYQRKLMVPVVVVVRRRDVESRFVETWTADGQGLTRHSRMIIPAGTVFIL
jgi:hypothetical protein